MKALNLNISLTSLPLNRGNLGVVSLCVFAQILFVIFLFSCDFYCLLFICYILLCKSGGNSHSSLREMAAEQFRITLPWLNLFTSKYNLRKILFLNLNTLQHGDVAFWNWIGRSSSSAVKECTWVHLCKILTVTKYNKNRIES